MPYLHVKSYSCPALSRTILSPRNWCIWSASSVISAGRRNAPLGGEVYFIALFTSLVISSPPHYQPPAPDTRSLNRARHSLAVS
ncbi:hypothetical protein BJX63DRAFT_223834 [Aspergillus granulosus]|uniref:Uncharacterized protein n=1 Tax=Aspergillus granulosus TaxID=176169 RepID=A0ABR4I474_9EURO